MDIKHGFGKLCQSAALLAGCLCPNVNSVFPKMTSPTDTEGRNCCLNDVSFQVGTLVTPFLKQLNEVLQKQLATISRNQERMGALKRAVWFV